MYKLFILALCLVFQSSIYSLHFNSIDGVDTTLNSYQGKKILIVNIATESNRVGQLGELEQLQQQFPDSLVVIGFPSNGFGNENKTDAQIKSFCLENYNTSFLLGQKISISGAAKSDIYNWLTSQNENGVMQADVAGDFQKYLIDESGNLVGSFSPGVSPMDTVIVNAIRTDYR